MKPRRQLIPLLVSVHVAVQAIVVFMIVSGGAGPGMIWIALVAALPSQGCLLAVWAALGRRPTPWRLAAAVVAIAALTWLLDRSYPDHDMAVFGLLLLAPLALVSAMLMIARFLGTELAYSPRGHSPDPLEPTRAWMQFSLRSLFSWTAALALVLGTLHYLPKGPLEEIASDLEMLALFSIVFAGAALIAVAAIWITLGTRWPPVRYVLLALATAAAAAPFCLISRADVGEMAVFCLAEVVWLVGSLWLVRLAGYRLIWRRRASL